MKLETERKLKYWLGNLTKILLAVWLIFKITQFAVNWYRGKQNTKAETSSSDEKRINTLEDTSNTTKSEENLNDRDDNKAVTGKKNAIISNSASIYIFNDQHLETQWVQQLGKTYFQEYGIRTRSGHNKAQLLAGDLSSSANTELVCVGTITYNYFGNSLGQISCKATLQFTTYKKSTGEIVLELTNTVSKIGPGSKRSDAKGVALQKIESVLATISPTS